MSTRVNLTGIKRWTKTVDDLHPGAHKIRIPRTGITSTIDLPADKACWRAVPG